MTDKIVNSIISNTSNVLLQNCKFRRRATLGASGVPKNLFIAFLFSDHDVGVQVLQDVGLIQALCCAVSADHKCPGVSTLVLRKVTHGDV
jgi:hypothetical protein